MQFYAKEAMSTFMSKDTVDPEDVITLMLIKFNLFNMIGLQVNGDEARACRSAIAPILSSTAEQLTTLKYRLIPEGSERLTTYHNEAQKQLRQLLGRAYKHNIHHTDDAGTLCEDQYILGYRGGRIARTMIKDWENITDDEIDNFISMFVGGYDTMVSSLLLGIRDLAMNPELQQALRSEAQDKYSTYFFAQSDNSILPELNSQMFNQEAFSDIWKFVEDTINKNPAVPIVIRDVTTDTA